MNLTRKLMKLADEHSYNGHPALRNMFRSQARKSARDESTVGNNRTSIGNVPPPTSEHLLSCRWKPGIE